MKKDKQIQETPIPIEEPTITETKCWNCKTMKETEYSLCPKCNKGPVPAEFFERCYEEERRSVKTS